MSWLVVCICVGVSLLLQAEGQGSFIEQPSSTVVQLGGTAIFKCRAFGHALYWYIDRAQVSQVHSATRGVIGVSTLLTDGSWDSTLSVSAVQMNNNSVVECAVFTFGVGETKSREVSVNIGILKAPENFIIVHKNGSCIHFSWTPPDVVPAVPISGFMIYVNNTQTGDFEKVPVEAHMTSYAYVPNDPSPCHVYEFHIAITHKGGEGERSDIIEGSLVTEPSSIQADSVGVMVGFFLSEVNITLTIKMNYSCNVDNYTVHLYSEGTFGSIHTGLNGSSVDEEDTIVLVLAASFLHVAENTHYTVLITAFNDIGHTNSSGIIHASTFDVQNVTAVEHPPGRLCLKCYFAGGSDAIGCSVLIHSTNVVHVDPLQITRAHPSANTASMCIDVIKGVYNISAYDLEKDGELSQFPAFETSKSVEGGASTSPTTKANSDNTGLVVGVTVSAGVLITAAGATLVLVLVVVYLRRKGSLNVEEGWFKTPSGNNDSPIMIITSRRTQEAHEQSEIETRRNTSYETHVPRDALQHNPAYEAIKLETTD